jgi:dUTP pyrophosphatase
MSTSTTLRICFNPEHSNFLKSKYNTFDNVLQHLTDVGFDLFLPEDIEVQPYETKFIDLGIKCEYKSDNDGTFYGYLLCPRSSISKTKLRLANSIGIIDPHYRGNLMAAVDNISDTVQKLKQGERYFQLVFTKFTKPDKVEVIEEDQLSKTERGDSGFGSTGR